MASTFPRDLNKLKRRPGTKKTVDQIRTFKRLIIKMLSLTTYTSKVCNINKLYPRKTSHETRQKNLHETHRPSIFYNVKHASIK